MLRLIVRQRFVVVAATSVLFKAIFETQLISRKIYRVTINFGNKTVYFDPLGGKSYSSRTVAGIVSLLRRRTDIEDQEEVIEHNFIPRIIYTDSPTALTWFQEKRTASRKKNSAVKKAEVFLKVMASEIDRIKVIHWNTVDWGEIPADFNEK